jgi:hypothetical protein
LDNDQDTRDNEIIKDKENDEKIIDGYKINDGRKRYNQNLLRNSLYIVISTMNLKV